MKKGTIVRIADGSFMFTTENGIITSFPSNRKKAIDCIGHCTDDFEVIDNDFMACFHKMKVHCDNGSSYRIDTVIRNKKTGEIWYCNSDINIREVPAPKPIPEYAMAELQSRLGHEFKIKK